MTPPPPPRLSLNRPQLQQPVSPRRTASWLSQLLFSWMLPLLQKGFRRPLTLDDVYGVLPGDESGFLGDQLERAWNEEVAKKKRPSLTRALVSVFGKTYAIYGINAFYEECILNILQPICLGLFLRFFAAPPGTFPPYMGYVFGGGVLLLSMTYMTTDHPFTFATQHLGMKMRISLSSLLYRKSLRMSRTVSGDTATTPGQIVNLLSSDMTRFDVLMTFLHYIWVAPLQLGIVIAVMYFYIDVGWPCLAGIAFIVLFGPFQGVMGHVFAKLREETAKRTDRRLVLMDEILQAIRTIKLYAWEDLFIKQVERARDLEVTALKKTAYCKSANQALFFVTSKVTLFLTLLAFVLSGRRLSSEIVFVSMALYTSVQLAMTLYFPAAVASFAESRVAIRRFQEFLLQPEFQKPTQQPKKLPHTPPEDFQPKTNKRQQQQQQQQQRRSSSSSRQRKGKNAAVSTGSLGVSRMFPNPTTVGISMRRVTAQWNPNSKDMAFSDVSLEVRSGEILALIGPVGSGKGSVIQTILYELPVIKGELKVTGSVAYAAQEPWIFPGSLRENILFGKEFDSAWYDNVVDACSLTRDLQLLPFGDHTLVGDRGTQLSGGQKARINLARAVYADADVYLLDDPLAAVDAEVGRSIVTKCILGLLKNKARILVTHQLQYLSSMSEILLLVDGFVTFRGDYSELRSSGIPFTDILLSSRLINSPRGGSSTGGGVGLLSTASSHQHHHTSSSTLVLENPTTKLPILPEPTTPFKDIVESSSAGGAGGSAASGATTVAAAAAVAAAVTPPISGDIVVGGVSGLNSKEEEDEEEAVVLGGLSWKLYYTYISAGTSIFALVLIIFISIATQVLFTVSDLWLQYWITAEENESAKMRMLKNSSSEDSSSSSSSWFGGLGGVSREVQVGVYSALVGSLFLLCLMRSVNFYRVCMQSSTELHTRLFFAVIKSPISFFENNPIGRVLNRFAKDLGVIDESLPPVLFDTLEIFLQAFGVVFIVSSSAPLMLIPAVILTLIFYFLRRFYFRTARALKRLEGVARSPVFSRLSTTQYGLPTIRAFQAEDMFRREFEVALDTHSSVWYLFIATSRWLGIVIDWISLLFVAAVMVNFLVAKKEEDAVVGLAVTSALMLTSMLQWGIRQSAELSNQMISVERVVTYCDLPPEPLNNASTDYSKPPEDWPPHGEIKMRNLSLLVPNSSGFILRNINCTIRGGEKVGVVGRTGAGKSSLLSVLFRLVEPSEGFVEIDGIMTSSVGLQDLRSRISIIPQEPVLFQGTVRVNLDPFHEFPDNEVWQVLQDVHLDAAVRDLPKGIYDAISEGGSNFSTGQKQLFCLARAILRSNQILVLDEATANVDPETDALIQRTLRVSFASCTVITIAHRLHTVMDSDRILVLDAGQVLEFEEPERLLSDRTSALYALAQQTGKAEAANLLNIARMKGTERKRMKRAAAKQKRRRRKAAHPLLGDILQEDDDDDDLDEEEEEEDEED